MRGEEIFLTGMGEQKRSHVVLEKDGVSEGSWE